MKRKCRPTDLEDIQNFFHYSCLSSATFSVTNILNALYEDILSSILIAIIHYFRL